MLPWEKGLYHKRQDFSSNGIPAESSSSSLALGTTVTAKDAIDTCHALIFYHLTRLLDSPLSTQLYRLGETMVSVCSFASDKDFLHAFFDHLLKRNHKDVLLRIDSTDLEQWLTYQQKDQPDLLLKYYQVQEKHVKAAEVAWSRANDAELSLNLHDRIECLIQAVDSYTMATSKAQTNVDELNRKMKQVEDSLGIARLQGRVLRTMESSEYELPEDDMHQLKHQLLTVNDLFNRYAMPCDMYENCLLLLYICRHEDVAHIQKFWKSIFCKEIFPCSTRSEHAYRSLRSFAEGSFVENPVVTLLDDATAAEESLFESGSWMKKLDGRVISLGKEVYGNAADYIFPIDFITACLEGKKQFDSIFDRARSVSHISKI
jgi:nuclear pore complex protein Nup155